MSGFARWILASSLRYKLYIWAFWILGCPFGDVLFKDPNNATFRMINILKGFCCFCLQVQTLDATLIIFGVVLNIFQISVIGMRVNLDLQLRVGNNLEIHHRLIMQSELQSNTAMYWWVFSGVSSSRMTAFHIISCSMLIGWAWFLGLMIPAFDSCFILLSTVLYSLMKETLSNNLTVCPFIVRKNWSKNTILYRVPYGYSSPFCFLISRTNRHKVSQRMSRSMLIKVPVISG